MEPIIPADTYPEEFAMVQAFLATASPDNVEHAIRFAFLCNVVNLDGAITYGITPPRRRLRPLQRRPYHRLRGPDPT